MTISRLRSVLGPVAGRELGAATAVHWAVHMTSAAGCVAVDSAALAPIELSQFQPANS